MSSSSLYLDFSFPRLVAFKPAMTLVLIFLRDATAVAVLFEEDAATFLTAFLALLFLVNVFLGIAKLIFNYLYVNDTVIDVKRRTLNVFIHIKRYG